MNLCDSNVWLALALSKHVHHRATSGWLDSLGTPGEALFCRATQQTFLRPLTNSSVLLPYGNLPLTNDQAWKAYQDLEADDRIALRVGEPLGLEQQWRRFALRGTASPNLWMDAYLAAFALSAGYRMVTTDVEFHQFSGLDVLVLA